MVAVVFLVLLNLTVHLYICTWLFSNKLFIYFNVNKILSPGFKISPSFTYLIFCDLSCCHHFIKLMCWWLSPPSNLLTVAKVLFSNDVMSTPAHTLMCQSGFSLFCRSNSSSLSLEALFQSHSCSHSPIPPLYIESRSLNFCFSHFLA